MNISLKQAADILNKSDDEVMFLVQQNKIQASVDQTALAWEFALDDVLKFKATLDKEETH